MAATKTPKLVTLAYTVSDADQRLARSLFPLVRERIREGLYFPNRCSNFCSRRMCNFADSAKRRFLHPNRRASWSSRPPGGRSVLAPAALSAPKGLVKAPAGLAQCQHEERATKASPGGRCRGTARRVRPGGRHWRRGHRRRRRRRPRPALKCSWPPPIARRAGHGLKRRDWFGLDLSARQQPQETAKTSRRLAAAPAAPSGHRRANGRPLGPRAHGGPAVAPGSDRRSRRRLAPRW